jgi:hypothetical protein
MTMLLLLLLLPLEQTCLMRSTSCDTSALLLCSSSCWNAMMRCSADLQWV